MHKQLFNLAYILTLCSFSAFGQGETKRHKLEVYLNENHIPLNKPNKLLRGYKLYYNCDSMAFMKRTQKDTIFIMTPSTEVPMTLEEFIPETKKKGFGEYTFPIKFYQDGRLIVDSYHLTTFLFRKDSLYELDEVSDYPTEAANSITNMFETHKIDYTVFEKKVDSLNEAFNKYCIVKFKLIFHPAMFNKSDTVVLDEKVNYKKSTIALLRKWKVKSKTCYNIQIKENWHGMDLLYGYMFDQDIHFIRWEGCISY